MTGSSTADTAIRIGRAAAMALLAGTVSGAAVLAGEAVLATSRRYAQPDPDLALRCTVGPPGAPPLRLIMMGDATALGVGVTRVEDTVGGQLARLLADGAGRPGAGRREVRLSSVGVVGSQSADLATQVARALLGEPPDVAVILIGANDATALRRPSDTAAHLGAAVLRLRTARVEVVVGTCPDLGAARAIAPPLRQVAAWLGRRTAYAHVQAAREAGGRVVDLGRETGPVFRADAGTLCYDGFHPSADGYRVWAHVLLPAAAEAAAVTSRN